MVLYLAGLVTHVWLVHLTSCEHIDSDKSITTLSTNLLGTVLYK